LILGKPQKNESIHPRAILKMDIRIRDI
jgi:hypothetical protein